MPDAPRPGGGAPTPAPPDTVLVVDDSATIRKFVAFALRARGLRVVQARDGLEALELLAHEGAGPGGVGLVVTDLNMPGLDGFGLVRALRDDPATAALPVVVLSSLASGDDLARGHALGVSAYLHKPLDPKRIQYEVSKHLA
ncbi:MAG: response regulator [Rhodothermales bacterium]|nr:response regulator [Rhodothermales bacterium]